jgi:hypothetical protein
MKSTKLGYRSTVHRISGAVITFIGIIVATLPANAAGWKVLSFTKESGDPLEGDVPGHPEIICTTTGDPHGVNLPIFHESEEESKRKGKRVLAGTVSWAIHLHPRMNIVLTHQTEDRCHISNVVFIPGQPPIPPRRLGTSHKARDQFDLGVSTPEITVFCRTLPETIIDRLQVNYTEWLAQATSEVQAACKTTLHSLEEVSYTKGDRKRPSRFEIPSRRFERPYTGPEDITRLINAIGSSWTILSEAVETANVEILGPAEPDPGEG